MADGYIISHLTIPDRYTDGDSGYILTRIPPIIPPTVDFGAMNHITFKCQRVNFYNNSTSLNQRWIFGDGADSFERNPHHFYKKAGTYQVRIIIDDVEYYLEREIIVFERSFILDAGAVFINYGMENERRLGVTEGGNTFGLVIDYRSMEFDGVRGEMTSSHRVVGSIPKIISNFISVDYSLFNTIIPGSEINYESGSVEIMRAIKRFLDEDYIKNIAIVAEHGSTGCYIIFKILNTITIENIEIPFEDSSESVIQCVFSGCFHPDELDDEPWQIEFITVN